MAKRPTHVSSVPERRWALPQPPRFRALISACHASPASGSVGSGGEVPARQADQEPAGQGHQPKGESIWLLLPRFEPAPDIFWSSLDRSALSILCCNPCLNLSTAISGEMVFSPVSCQ